MSSTDSITEIASNPWYLAKPEGSLFHDVTCLEYPSAEQIHGFVMHKMGTAVNESGFGYQTELIMMERYEERFDKSMNAFRVMHSLPAHGWGRVEPHKHLSMSVMWRSTRHGLAQGKYDDIDMKCAHPTILLGKMREAGYKCEALGRYAENPPRLLGEIMTQHGCNKHTAKTLVISMLNGGGFKQWAKNNNTTASCLPEVVAIEQELKSVMDKVYAENHHIETDVLAHNSNRWRSLIDKKRGVMSLWLQTHERIIQESAIRHLTSEYNIPLRDIVPCQDGFMVLKGHSREGMEVAVTNFIHREFNLPIIFVRKEFDEAIEIPSVDLDEVVIAEGRSYDDVCAKFEKTHSNIILKGIFMCETKDEFVTMTKSHLNSAYGFMTYDRIVKGKIETCGFLEKWLYKNESQRRYMNVDVYPDIKKCPPDHLNLWTPFEMEHVVEYEEKKEELEFMLAHIKILCKGEEYTYKYFICWIAQMIQFPDVKSTMIILVSKQGSGKGSLIKLLRAMLGKLKVHLCSTPERDVWGSFNGMMSKSFLVNLDELAKKTAVESLNRIKALVTEPTIDINNKGTNQYTIRSHHRFIATTNSDDPIPTDVDDRRSVIIRSSDELKDNVDYFKRMNKMIRDVNVVKTCYEYFKNLPDVDKFEEMPRPMTEFQKNLTMLGYSTSEQWLMHYVASHKGGIVPAQIMYQSYSEWCRANDLQFVGSNVKFGVSLANKSIPGLTKAEPTKKGKMWSINRDLIMSHFNMDASAPLATAVNEEDETESNCVGSDGMYKGKQIC